MSAANPTLGNTTKLGSAAEFAEKYSTTALRFFLLAVAKHLLPDERLKICWRYPLPERKTVDVIYSEERQRARAAGTMKCGCAWICPVCSQYIAERRRVELGQALLESRDKYIAVMITYTAQHHANMHLKPVMDKMQRAFRYVKTGRAWQEIKDEFALVGSVRAIEVTYGASGWHPHFHELMFVDIDHIRDFYVLDTPEGVLSGIPEYAEGLETVMASRWIGGLQRENMTASEEIGLRVSTTTKDAAEYIAKYGKLPLETDFAGSANEVSCGMTKTARNGNLSVWELLYQANTDLKSAVLFQEYAAATKGRSQLQWSRGLKSLLNIDVIRDELACEGIETETDRLLASIDVEFWRLLADKNHLGQVMTYAHTGDKEKLQDLLLRLEQKYAPQTWVIPQFDLGH